MARLSEKGERRIVADLVRKLDPEGKMMLGDDCAVLDNGKDYLLITTDMITADTHIPEGAKPADIGWYAAAVNLSDIAAMGGEPQGMLFALGLSKETESEWLDFLMSGIRECCETYSAPVLGGDTKENASLTICGIAFGRVPKESMLRRSGAGPGDVVGMTGALGRGVLWERGRSDVSKILRVVPRVKEGLALAKSGNVTSCIDMSDGLSTSLHLLSEASGVGFDIEHSSMPWLAKLDDGEQAAALHWGGDFELLFTVKKEAADDLFGNTAGVTRIGTVTAGRKISLRKGDGDIQIENLGYEHFGRER